MEEDIGVATMLHLLFTADSFRESTLDELSGMSDYSIVDEYRNIMLVDIKKAGVEGRLDSSVFIYSHFPIMKTAELGADDYVETLHNIITTLGIGKGKKLKLECYDINCKQDYSAKDIEVALGERMEKESYNINIIEPDTLAYVVLLNSRCYAGFIELAKSRHSFVDPFRVYKDKNVSRSEFKIAEAFETFDLMAPGRVIDLGAAPGGWSAYLAGFGSSVIAIDNGELDRKAITKSGIGLEVVGDLHIEASGLKPKNIVHIRCSMEEALEKLGGIKVDMLLDDMNMGGIKSSEAVLMYSRLLRKGGTLIMTVKCIYRKVTRYIGEVEEILKPKFEIKLLKVLPHNRQEVTLFAVKK